MTFRTELHFVDVDDARW